VCASRPKVSVDDDHVLQKSLTILSLISLLRLVSIYLIELFCEATDQVLFLIVRIKIEEIIVSWRYKPRQRVAPSIRQNGDRVTYLFDIRIYRRR
jgi:hypothetical protein